MLYTMSNLVSWKCNVPHTDDVLVLCFHSNFPPINWEKKLQWCGTWRERERERTVCFCVCGSVEIENALLVFFEGESAREGGVSYPTLRETSKAERRKRQMLISCECFQQILTGDIKTQMYIVIAFSLCLSSLAVILLSLFYFPMLSCIWRHLSVLYQTTPLLLICSTSSSRVFLDDQWFNYDLVPHVSPSTIKLEISFFNHKLEISFHGTSVPHLVRRHWAYTSKGSTINNCLSPLCEWWPSTQDRQEV